MDYKMPNEKNQYQYELLKNRLQKRYKHLKKWAKRSGIFCYRLYDKDIPEIPLAIDLYTDENQIDKYIQMALYQRPYEKDENEENLWLEDMKKAICEVLDIQINNIFVKIRKHQKENLQYEKNTNASNDRKIVVVEQGAKFFVKMSSYLDTGLFFDHRPLRKIVRENCQGKSILNLFCYTGSFSVYGAQGKAKSVDSVDLSNTYLDWAKDNFKLNNINIDESLSSDNSANMKNNSSKKYNFHNADTFEFLEKAKSQNKKWDIIILDPPTFSNSKKTENVLDINKDWPKLVNLCTNLLTDNGILYFSTNSKKLVFNSDLLNNSTSIDITPETIPEDYRNGKIHRCWKITKN